MSTTATEKAAVAPPKDVYAEAVNAMSRDAATKVNVSINLNGDQKRALNALLNNTVGLCSATEKAVDESLSKMAYLCEQSSMPKQVPEAVSRLACEAGMLAAMMRLFAVVGAVECPELVPAAVATMQSIASEALERARELASERAAHARRLAESNAS